MAAFTLFIGYGTEKTNLGHGFRSYAKANHQLAFRCCQCNFGPRIPGSGSEVAQPRGFFISLNGTAEVHRRLKAHSSSPIRSDH